MKLIGNSVNVMYTEIAFATDMINKMVNSCFKKCITRIQDGELSTGESSFPNASIRLSSFACYSNPATLFTEKGVFLVMGLAGALVLRKDIRTRFVAGICRLGNGNTLTASPTVAHSQAKLNT
eukprot:IDg19636t1